MNKDKLKDNLTLSDIETVLKYYNADFFYNHQGDIQCQTVCHNHHPEHGSHKLYYYPESATFHCYTQCAENFDIYDLIININKARGNEIDFHEAYLTLASILNVNTNSRVKRKIGFGEEESQLISDWDWIANLQGKKEVNLEIDLIDSNILDHFDFEEWYPKEWLNEGISIETMEKYGIKFYPERNQTIIPHCDIENNLLGIRVRNWRRETDKVPKYAPLWHNGKMYNHPLGYHLYSIYESKEAIQKKKTAILVESEKSCMKAHTYFGENSCVVGMSGSSLNSHQADMLLELGIETIVISVDRDYKKNPDEMFKQKVKNIARHFLNKVNIKVVVDTRGVMEYQECLFDKDKETVLNILEYDLYDLDDIDRL